ncbi:arginine--tRNA ligase, partial [Escherichia coli]|nr:arginine--tRNA ligase [Escherichia coli]
MIRIQQALGQALAAALDHVSPGHGLSPAFEKPKQAAHGDLAVTVAMQLARPLKKNPREVAQALVEGLQRREAFQRWVEAMEIAGPGFVNLRL